jgi:hypothetical protein
VFIVRFHLMWRFLEKVCSFVNSLIGHCVQSSSQFSQKISARSLMCDSFPIAPKEIMLPQLLQRMAVNCMPLDFGLKGFKRPHFVHLANLSFWVFFPCTTSNTASNMP